jgi:hypothetical protein
VHLEAGSLRPPATHLPLRGSPRATACCWVPSLSTVRCTSNPSGTDFSIGLRPPRNASCRCLGLHGVICSPVATAQGAGCAPGPGSASSRRRRAPSPCPEGSGPDRRCRGPSRPGRGLGPSLPEARERIGGELVAVRHLRSGAMSAGGAAPRRSAASGEPWC